MSGCALSRQWHESSEFIDPARLNDLELARSRVACARARAHIANRTLSFYKQQQCSLQPRLGRGLNFEVRAWQRKPGLRRIYSEREVFRAQIGPLPLMVIT